MDVPKASLLDLPDDILLATLEWVDVLPFYNRRDMLAVTGTCRRLYHLGLPILYRNPFHLGYLTDDPGDDRQILFGDTLKHSPELG